MDDAIRQVVAENDDAVETLGDDVLHRLRRRIRQKSQGSWRESDRPMEVHRARRRDDVAFVIASYGDSGETDRESENGEMQHCRRNEVEKDERGEDAANDDAAVDAGAAVRRPSFQILRDHSSDLRDARPSNDAVDRNYRTASNSPYSGANSSAPHVQSRATRSPLPPPKHSKVSPMRPCFRSALVTDGSAAMWVKEDEKTIRPISDSFDALRTSE